MNKIHEFEKAYKAVEDANNKLMSSVETLSCIVKKLTGRNIIAMLTGSGDVEFRVCSDDDCEDPDALSTIYKKEILRCIEDKNYEPFILR